MTGPGLYVLFAAGLMALAGVAIVVWCTWDAEGD